MADRVSKETRSRIMASIRGKDTYPEKLARALLTEAGLRYRLHVKGLPGTPDIVLPKFRAVVFVNGCFWHGHNCLGGRRPGVNRTFWETKIQRNISRDRSAARKLRSMGWRVFTVWECRLEGGIQRTLRGLGLLGNRPSPVSVGAHCQSR